MGKGYRIVVLLVVVLAVGAVLIWGRGGPAGEGRERGEVAAALPRLVDLGSSQCIPCKKMAPILAALETEFAGRMEVLFIDVREDKQAAVEYGIRLIPTQIFYGPDGTELARHEGFIGREDILARWRELGVDIGAAGTTRKGAEG
jgi:thioredoxin 1